MEQSTLKCIYEFTDCTRELDCTNCPVKNRYYKELNSDVIAASLSVEQPIIIA